MEILGKDIKVKNKDILRVKERLSNPKPREVKGGHIYSGIFKEMSQKLGKKK